jgi:hypothetical protein
VVRNVSFIFGSGRLQRASAAGATDRTGKEKMFTGRFDRLSASA